MTERENDIMLHALGGTGYRNYYVAGPGHTEYDTLEKMVSDGLMTRRERNRTTDLYIYHVTPSGQRIVGVFYKD